MIVITNISKVFNKETAIQLNNYTFEDNKSYCILGPSGSGKSTLLNMLAGIVKPTTGKIEVDGVDISKSSQAELDKYRCNTIGYICQEFKLLDNFTVRDNIDLISANGKVSNSTDEVLRLVGLENKHKSKVRTLSGGEKQRAAIARTLLKSPKTMLCDEPTGSLNREMSLEIVKLLKEIHQKTKNTLIVVTHDDRIASLFDVTIKFEEELLREGK